MDSARSGNGRSAVAGGRLNLPPGMSPNSLQLQVDTPRKSGNTRTRLPNLFGPPPPSPSPSPSLSPSLTVPQSPGGGGNSYSDRFIPSRSASRFDAYGIIGSGDGGSAGKHRTPTKQQQQQQQQQQHQQQPESPPGASAYTSLLRAELFGSDMAGTPVSPRTPERPYGTASGGGRRSPLTSSSPVSVSKNLFRYMGTPTSVSPYAESPLSDGLAASHISTPKKPPRKICKVPYKILDAPALQDDFYLNLVDWSTQNVLAVGLGTCIYLWNASNCKVTKLCDLGVDDSVCSVSFTHQGNFLSMGSNLGEVQIWDVARCKKIRTMGGHTTRTGALAWNSHILSSGSRDRNVFHRDIRCPEDYTSKLTGHKSEVCGLKWSPDDRELASGGNDNQLLVWNLQSTQPVLKFCEHTAAVKAIAWSPHQRGILASGGGTADRCIRFWNTINNSRLSCVDTGSQVCNLMWCQNINELVSTHGYSQNQIMVWRYPNMNKLATLTGHSLRVLYLATSPDGQTIVTGAGDETLRFWNIFPSQKSQGSSMDSGLASHSRSLIR